MMLMAAFNALLYRYSGQGDISMGTPVAGRGRAETEGLIGLFANTVVLRVRVEAGDEVPAAAGGGEGGGAGGLPAPAGAVRQAGRAGVGRAEPEPHAFVQVMFAMQTRGGERGARQAESGEAGWGGEASRGEAARSRGHDGEVRPEPGDGRGWRLHNGRHTVQHRHIRAGEHRADGQRTC